MDDVIKLTEAQANARIIIFLERIMDFVDAEIRLLDEEYEFNRSVMHHGRSVKELSFITKARHDELLRMALASEGYPISRLAVSNTSSKYKYFGYYQSTDSLESIRR